MQLALQETRCRLGLCLLLPPPSPATPAEHKYASHVFLNPLLSSAPQESKAFSPALPQTLSSPCFKSHIVPTPMYLLIALASALPVQLVINGIQFSSARTPSSSNYPPPSNRLG